MESKTNVSNFTLISLNVRGIRAITKRKQIFEWCKSKGGDVIFLQEAYNTKDVEEKWKKHWGGQILFSHGTNHSRGTLVVLFSKIKVKGRSRLSRHR